MAEALDELRAIAAGREQARTEEVAALLERLLRQEWDRSTTTALEEIAATLEQQGGQMARDEVDELIGQMRPFLQSQLRSAVQTGVATAVETSYSIGQEAVSVEAAASLNVTDRRVQNFLSDNATFWVGNHYDQQVQERIRDAADEVFENEGGVLGRRKAARKFRDAFGQQFQKSESYWRMLSNDVTTKSREFGRVEGFVKAGIEEYMIDAILDRRTSDICRTLDGKVFDVEQAVEHRDAVVSADEPEAIKEQSPWLEAEVIEPLSNEELAERGVLTPPFHGNCRTSLRAL